MAALKNISDILKKDRHQRILYGLGLLVWIIFWINQRENLDLSGFQYLWLIIPTLLFIGQLLFNNKIVWALMIGLVGSYSLLIIFNFLFLEILIDLHRDYAPGSIWDLKKVLKPLLFFTILILLNWTLWKIKPNKKTLHNSI